MSNLCDDSEDQINCDCGQSYTIQEDYRRHLINGKHEVYKEERRRLFGEK